MAPAACFLSGSVVPGAALQALLAKEPLSLACVDLLCCSQQPAQASQPTETKYNVVLAASNSPHSQDALVRVARAMAPGGRLYVYETASRPVPAASRDAGGITRVDALKKDLLLSGFTDAQALDDDGLSSGAASTPAVWVTAQLPIWGLGAAAKLSLKRPAAPVAPAAPFAPAPAPAAAGVWKLSADADGDDGAEEDEELVDEDLLLTAEDRKAATAPKADDCEVGASGRKACKNCSCGRAEAEAAGASGAKLTADLLGDPQSACGNCYLGDAFRCASCPYRGLPAFQPGEKITLAAGLLAADV